MLIFKNRHSKIPKKINIKVSEIDFENVLLITV